MTRQEAAKQLVELYAEAVRLGVYDQDVVFSEVVALAVGALLKDDDNDG